MLTHLLLMRHAKSSWKDAALSDHARPLNKRGREEADIIAQTLCAKALAPDIIWASDAARTQETAARLIRIIPGAQTIIKVPEFYHASAASVIEQCSNADEPDGKLMLVGHNPAWSDLAQDYSGHAMDLPTACCLIFKRRNGHVANWASPKNWQFLERLNAKELLSKPDVDVDMP